MAAKSDKGGDMSALYARISTSKQDIKVQKDRLIEYAERNNLPNPKLYNEQMSGAKYDDRPQMQAILDKVKNGEVTTIVVTKIDRLARSLKDLLDIVELLQAKNCNLISLDDQIDLKTPMGRFFFQLIGAISEFERSLILERAQHGREYAVKYGSRSGLPCHRPRKELDMERVTEYFEKGLTMKETVKLMKVSVRTLQRRIKESGLTLTRTLKTK
jgi:DNA invertase Pin-like site-specific DNA recombinase